MYKSVLGLFGEERELNKVTGRLKEIFVDETDQPNGSTIHFYNLQ